MSARCSPRPWTGSSCCTPTTSRMPPPPPCAWPGSSGANPFACIAAGIAALWGPSHGGANEAVLEMLEEIGDVSRIDEFVARAKDKERPLPPDGLRPPRLQELRPPRQVS